MNEESFAEYCVKERLAGRKPDARDYMAKVTAARIVEHSKALEKEPSEASLERYAKKQVEARGGLYLKFVSPGFTGVPDRLCIKPDGSMFFVEHKAPGGRLSARQKIVVSQLNDKNVIVYILDSKQAIDNMVKLEFE